MTADIQLWWFLVLPGWFSDQTLLRAWATVRGQGAAHDRLVLTTGRRGATDLLCLRGVTC